VIDANHILIVAQDGGGGGGGSGLLIGLFLAMMVYMFIMFSGSRKEKRRRQEMLANMQKNDRVMTIGGIIGSIVSVHENEVTLKVDESANVKITVIRSAIQRVLRDDERPKELE